VEDSVCLNDGVERWNGRGVLVAGLLRGKLIKYLPGKSEESILFYRAISFIPKRIFTVKDNKKLYHSM
jgi:hypothetical protein